MATYTFTIDDSTKAGARFLALAKDMSKLYKESVKVGSKKSHLSVAEKSIERGFEDLKEVLNGNEVDRDIDELINELQDD